MSIPLTTPRAAEPSHDDRGRAPLTVRGVGLSIADIAQVAGGRRVALTDDESTRRALEQSREFVDRAVEAGTPIYGVTTLVGGMANQTIARDTAAHLQNNLIWAIAAGSGGRLPADDVRAAMLLRMNTLARGISGVRVELLERFATFLNAGVTPHVPECGSIGASGDLVPLAYIAGALIGASDAFTVDMDGEELGAIAALTRLGLSPLPLEGREGLALINGTSVMAGIAANCVHRARRQLALGLGAHALLLQALHATNQSFHPFVHAHKPHHGQVWTAARMLDLLRGSSLILDELDGVRQPHSGDLMQDRYSIRCLPQFLGPVVDGFAQIGGQVEVEANAVTDNPLIDAAHDAVYHGGNFLGQYIGVGMDQLRYYIGLTAKHLDVQIALLVAPEFNRGLPASLVGNTARPVNIGLKALQISANSIMPMLTFYGNSLADRFPTHAEQFNQNVNSLGFGSANLARRSTELFDQYLAIALLFGVQGADLRTRLRHGHYDARRTLAPATVPLYEAVRRVARRAPSADRPFLWDDSDLLLGPTVAMLVRDLASGGEIVASVADLVSALDVYTAS